MHVVNLPKAGQVCVCVCVCVYVCALASTGGCVCCVCGASRSPALSEAISPLTQMFLAQARKQRQSDDKQKLLMAPRYYLFT